MQRCVAVRGLVHSAVGGRCGEVPGLDVGRGVGRAQGCVSSVRQLVVELCALCGRADRLHGGGPQVEVAVAARDDEMGVQAHAQAVLKPTQGHRLTALAAPAGIPVVRSRSACRRRWRMTSASTVWTHGLQVPFCRGREAATPSPSGTVPEMATAHMRVRSAARATLVACLQGLPPDATEDVWPQASGIQ